MIGRRAIGRCQGGLPDFSRLPEGAIMKRTYAWMALCVALLNGAIASAQNPFGNTRSYGIPGYPAAPGYPYAMPPIAPYAPQAPMAPTGPYGQPAFAPQTPIPP